jgi:hypothetical protein
MFGYRYRDGIICRVSKIGPILVPMAVLTLLNDDTHPPFHDGLLICWRSWRTAWLVQNGRLVGTLLRQRDILLGYLI